MRLCGSLSLVLEAARPFATYVHHVISDTLLTLYHTYCGNVIQEGMQGSQISNGIRESFRTYCSYCSN